MSTSNDIKRLARALRFFADESGAPNGISPGELSAEYTDLAQFRIGRLVKREREALNRELAAHGYQITSYDGPHEGYGMRIGITTVQAAEG